MAKKTRPIRRKNFIDEVLNAEDFHKTMLEYSPDCCYIHDLNGVIVYGNRAAERLIGCKREEFIGKSLFKHKILSKDQVPQVRQGIKDIIAKRSSKPQEFTITRKDGTKVTTEVMSYLIKIKNIPLVLGIAHDITERKKIEKALKITEERFNQVTENSEEWIWEVDTKGMYTYSSSAVKKILGYSPAEIVGKKHFYDFFEPSIRQSYKKMAFAAFAKKESFRNFVNSNIHKNGNIVVLETNGVPFFDSKGRLLGYRGSDNDVTKQKKYEEELLKFKTAFERSMESIFMTDKNGIILYVNPAFEKLYGYKKEFAVGKTPRIIKSGVHKSDFYKKFWKKLLAKNIVPVSITNKTSDNRLINVEGSANPILDKNGEIIGFIALQHDVTTRRMSEEEVRNLNTELQKKVEELEKISRLTINRELKMIELKKELKSKNNRK